MPGGEGIEFVVAVKAGAVRLLHDHGAGIVAFAHKLRLDAHKGVDIPSVRQIAGNVKFDHQIGVGGIVDHVMGVEPIGIRWEQIVGALNAGEHEGGKIKNPESLIIAVVSTSSWIV